MKFVYKKYFIFALVCSFFSFSCFCMFIFNPNPNPNLNRNPTYTEKTKNFFLNLKNNIFDIATNEYQKLLGAGLVGLVYGLKNQNIKLTFFKAIGINIFDNVFLGGFLSSPTGYNVLPERTQYKLILQLIQGGITPAFLLHNTTYLNPVLISLFVSRIFLYLQDKKGGESFFSSVKRQFWNLEEKAQKIIEKQENKDIIIKQMDTLFGKIARLYNYRYQNIMTIYNQKDKEKVIFLFYFIPQINNIINQKFYFYCYLPLIKLNQYYNFYK